MEFNSKNNDKMQTTGQTMGERARPSSPPQQPAYKSKHTTCFTTCKKIIYFAHFIFIALLTTQIIVTYPHARQLSFTLCALVVFGYMAIWTLIINFSFIVIVFLMKVFGKENWAVMFDRLFIKFFMMLWPICAIISYVHQNFLNITEVAIFSLYMCFISLLLVIYQLYTCTFAQHQNPQFIFQPNDLTLSDDVVWKQRKLYNQNLMNRNKINVDA